MIRKISYVFLVSSVLSSCVVTCKQQHEASTTVETTPGKVDENPPIQLDTATTRIDTSKPQHVIEKKVNVHLPVSDSMAVH